MKNRILDKLNEESVINIMQRYGTRGRVGKDNTIWFRTVCHGGKKDKLCYFTETKSFYCFTECGNLSIFDIVMRIEKCSFHDAIIKLLIFLNIDSRVGILHDVNSDMKKISKYLEIKNKKRTIYEIEKPIDCQNELNYFENNVFYKGWVNENISIETQIKYQILWYELEKEIIIPHHNELGQVIGIRRRSLLENHVKYMPLTFKGETKKYTHSLNKNFYGLDKNIEYIKKIKKVVLVESEKGVMQSDTYYGEDSYTLGTSGFNISNWHVNKLIELGVEEVILGFDKDFDVLDYSEENSDKFYKFIDRLVSLSRKLSPYFKTYVIQDRLGLTGLKDSPFDKGKYVLEELMRNKIEIGTWECEE